MSWDVARTIQNTDSKEERGFRQHTEWLLIASNFDARIEIFIQSKFQVEKKSTAVHSFEVWWQIYFNKNAENAVNYRPVYCNM